MKLSVDINGMNIPKSLVTAELSLSIDYSDGRESIDVTGSIINILKEIPEDFEIGVIRDIIDLLHHCESVIIVFNNGRLSLTRDE